MNIKQFETNLENVKKFSPEVYQDTMHLSVPFFMLHKKIYEQGDSLLRNEYDLNQSELDILGALYYMTDGTFTLTPTQLYEVMLFSSGGMTKVLKKLETKAYIKRADNPQDKRSKLVQLTKKGQEITQNALQQIVSFENNYFSKLDQAEQMQLKALLLKMIDEN